MILRITVDDAGYHDLMHRFCREIANCSPTLPVGPTLEDERNRFGSTWIDLQQKLRLTMLAPDAELDDGDKEWLLLTIAMCFDWFVKERVPKEKDRSALKRRFYCETIPYVDTTWQNGDDFFLFPTSRAAKVVCL